MMYWIVFALFTCGETLADMFISWSVVAADRELISM